MPFDLARLQAHLVAAERDIAAWAQDPHAAPMRKCRERDARALRAAIDATAGAFQRAA